MKRPLTVAALATLTFLSWYIPSASARVRCRDFSTQAEAQAYMQANGATYLDGDNDGVACESLPRGTSSGGLPSQPGSPSQSAIVVSTGDGDTLRVREGATAVTVRVGCVDAPEMAQKPWGPQAAARLKQLLPPGQAVQLRKIDTDRYGRTVAEVFVEGQSIGLRMVREGRSVVYPQFIDGCSATKTSYLQAQNRAKQQGLGVWNPAKPMKVMPWEYRKGARSS